MPLRLLVILLPAMAIACADARAPGDAPACAGQAECMKLYRAAEIRLQQCLRENMASRGSPNGATPPACDALQRESAAYAAALHRYQDPHDLGAGAGEGPASFEVQPLPSATAPAAPPPR